MLDPIHDLFNSDIEDDSEEEASDEEEEEEEELGGRVALAFDLSQLSGCVGLPQNGHDHLKLVQTERLLYPAVISAPKPNIDNPKTNQIIKSNCDEEDDLKYCDEILNNFKRLREKVEIIRQGAEIVSVPNQDTLETSLKYYVEEEEENKDNLLVSIDEPENQLDTKIQLVNKDESEKKVNNLLKLMELGHPPQASSLIDKSQLELHKTLEMIADHCEMTPNYCTIHTDWIYSLMASLREPIEPDIYSTLRRLARLCITKRDSYQKKKRFNDDSDDVPATAGSSTQLEDEEEEVVEEVVINEFMGSEKKKKKKKRRSNNSNNKKREAKKLRKQLIRNKLGARRGNRDDGAENNEELVRELEEEEYTSSLLIICIVRHYFGQTDLK